MTNRYMLAQVFSDILRKNQIAFSHPCATEGTPADNIRDVAETTKTEQARTPHKMGWWLVWQWMFERLKLCVRITHVNLLDSVSKKLPNPQFCLPSGKHGVVACVDHQGVGILSSFPPASLITAPVGGPGAPPTSNSALMPLWPCFCCSMRHGRRNSDDSSGQTTGNMVAHFQSATASWRFSVHVSALALGTTLLRVCLFRIGRRTSNCSKFWFTSLGMKCDGRSTHPYIHIANVNICTLFCTLFCTMGPTSKPQTRQKLQGWRNRERAREQGTEQGKRTWDRSKGSEQGRNNKNRCPKRASTHAEITCSSSGRDRKQDQNAEKKTNPVKLRVSRSGGTRVWVSHSLSRKAGNC